MTSLSSGKLRLTIDGADHPVRFDAQRGCVEWFDVPTRAPSVTDDTSAASSDKIVRLSYRTAEMRLDIDQPGDLFDREEVVAEAEAELPGLLLSGMQARLFDARGRRSRGGLNAEFAVPARSGRRPSPASQARRKPTSTSRPSSAQRAAAKDSAQPTAPGPDVVIQRSVVRTRCAVSLRDAFARRAFRPHQSLHFDEVIPAQERVADIEAVLTSLGFTTTETNLEGSWEGRKPDESLWFVRGIRGDQVSGANAAEVWIVVRGRRHFTRRQSERSAGTTYTTRVPTGEIELFVRGTTLGNPDTLMEQMNALHRLLKDRFRPMRSQR